MQLIHADIVHEDLQKAGVVHTCYFIGTWHVEVELIDHSRIYTGFREAMEYIRDGCPGAVREA